MLDRLVLILLGVFMVLYGIFAVTNLKIEWSTTIMGFAALILGIVCLVRAIKHFQ